MVEWFFALNFMVIWCCISYVNETPLRFGWWMNERWVETFLPVSHSLRVGAWPVVYVFYLNDHRHHPAHYHLYRHQPNLRNIGTNWGGVWPPHKFRVTNPPFTKQNNGLHQTIFHTQSHQTAAALPHPMITPIFAQQSTWLVLNYRISIISQPNV